VGQLHGANGHLQPHVLSDLQQDDWILPQLGHDEALQVHALL
jgi:hypothetical protein